MDPVQNLLEQRAIAERLLEEFNADDAIMLAELVLVLDRWRRQGGFDPYLAQPSILQ